ncbi:MAG: DUF2142 domain-containing protein [Clostridia bacterium]|nr:DUF2142 domain-containing protein [Clostridia bacterium]
MLDKLKKIINKARYITEFIVTIIFTFFLASTIYIKNYMGYFHKLYLIGTVVCFLILVINIIYNFRKSDKKIEKIFLNIAIPIGMLYLMFMIPGHVPDETTHFIKAYDVSMGNLVTKMDENGDSSITVPVGLTSYNHTEVKNYNDFINLTKTKTDYNNTEKVISTAQGNSFIMYIFPAVAFLLTRIMNINIIFGILLGRIFNFIFFLICSYFAIKKISFGKLVLAVYMLMPTCMQQATSISADAFINSILLYYIAYSIYMIFKKDKLSKKEILGYIVLTGLVGILKMVYILIAGVGFLIIKRKDLTKKEKTIIILITIVFGSIVMLASYISSTKYTSTTEANIIYQEQFNVNSSEQIALIMKNPKHVIKAFINDWYYMGKHYVYMAIGSELGWLEIKPSETIITAYLILLILATVSEKNQEEFNMKNKIWLMLISMGVIALVEIAMYTGFTPIGAEFIGGVQGRYYIPIYILLLLCLSKKENYVKIKNSKNIFILIAALLNLCVTAEIILYFI